MNQKISATPLRTSSRVWAFKFQTDAGLHFLSGRSISWSIPIYWSKTTKGWLAMYSRHLHLAIRASIHFVTKNSWMQAGSAPSLTIWLNYCFFLLKTPIMKWIRMSIFCAIKMHWPEKVNQLVRICMLKVLGTRWILSLERWIRRRISQCQTVAFSPLFTSVYIWLESVKPRMFSTHASSIFSTSIASVKKKGVHFPKPGTSRYLITMAAFSCSMAIYMLQNRCSPKLLDLLVVFHKIPRISRGSYAT